VFDVSSSTLVLALVLVTPMEAWRAWVRPAWYLLARMALSRGKCFSQYWYSHTYVETALVVVIQTLMINNTRPIYHLVLHPNNLISTS